MILVKEQLCDCCGACTSICPSKSVQINLEKDNLFLKYFQSSCSDCNKCVRICPQRALSSKKTTDN